MIWISNSGSRRKNKAISKVMNSLSAINFSLFTLSTDVRQLSSEIDALTKKNKEQDAVITKLMTVISEHGFDKTKQDDGIALNAEAITKLAYCNITEKEKKGDE